MEQRKANMDRTGLIRATSMAKHRVKDALKRAKEVETDARKEERLKSQTCSACFYWPRMAGAAICSRPCMSCEEPQTYSSTDTDKLCRPCAVSGELCKRCGGDIEMREKRQHWPSPAINTPSH